MKKEKIAIILLIIVAITWGATFLPVSHTIKLINVPSFLAWRFLLAAVLMWVIFAKKVKFDKISLIFGGILGISLFLDFTLQTYALNYIYSSKVAFIVGLNIVFVPFLAFILIGQKIEIFSIFSVILAGIGLYFLSGSKNLEFEIGEILALISSISYAAHIVITAIAIRKTKILALVVTQFFAMSFLSFFTAIFFCQTSQNSLIGGLEFIFDKVFLMTLLFCVLIATIFAFGVQSWAQKSVSSEKTALIYTLEPVSAGFIGYFIGLEYLNISQIFGAFMIICAIFLAEFGKKLVKFMFKN